MGRNSVEATKASLIRAVRALRTSRLACGWCLRGLLLAVRTVGFAPALAVGVADFVVALPVELVAFVAALAGAFVFCRCLAVGLAGVLCVLVEAEAVGVASCLPADRAAAGSAIISREARTTMQPEASRATGIGEETAFILLL
jgi:hypothetical protein